MIEKILLLANYNVTPAKAGGYPCPRGKRLLKTVIMSF